MSQSGLSFRFTNAIVRRPARSVLKGLRAVDRGAPDVEIFQQEHRGYIRALRESGVEVSILQAREEYPDSVFIEDAALVLPQGAIQLRPGTPSRTGESAQLAPELEHLGLDIHPLGPGGFVDGGDILVTDSAVLVGLSARTDQAGFEALEALLRAWGYEVLCVETPGEVLHFKSDCCVLDSSTIMATSRLSDEQAFSPFRVLTVPAGEEPAANSIRVNDKLLVPAGFPQTADMLQREGFTVVEVPVTQASLLDGGLSCMSLRFSRCPGFA